MLYALPPTPSSPFFINRWHRFEDDIKTRAKPTFPTACDFIPTHKECCDTQVKVILHCTFSVAELDWTVVTSLIASQTYCPLSSLVTFVMVNCLSSDDKLILEPAVRTEPVLVHRKVGEGFPIALQVKVTLSPSVFVLFFGCKENSGWSVLEKNRLIIHWLF